MSNFIMDKKAFVEELKTQKEAEQRSDLYQKGKEASVEALKRVTRKQELGSNDTALADSLAKRISGSSTTEDLDARRGALPGGMKRGSRFTTDRDESFCRCGRLKELHVQGQDIGCPYGRIFRS